MRRVEVDDPGYFVRILVHKASGRRRAGVVDQNSDPIIFTGPSLYQDEFSYIGEIGPHDINLDSSLPAEAVGELLHSGAITRD